MLIARLTVMAFVVLGAADAVAYVRTKNAAGVPVAWRTPSIEIEVRPGPTTFDVDGAAFHAAAARAAAAWSWPAVPCTSVEIEISPADPSFRLARDGRNTLAVQDALWCMDGDVLMACYDAEAAAQTTVYVRTSTPGGEILEADLEVNGVDFRWAVLPEGGDAAQRGELRDVENVLAHEVGHLLGFAHPCRFPGEPAEIDQHGDEIPLCSAASAAIQESTMFPSGGGGEILRRSLSPDDVLALCEVYPRTTTVDGGGRDGEAPVDATDEGVTPGGGAGGGCGCGTGAGLPEPSIVAVATAVAALARRPRRRTVLAALSN